MSSQASLTALLKQASLNDHEEVLRAAQAALRSNQKDTSAQITAAVALLKLDRFEETVKIFENGGTTLKQSAPLVYAYALYKTSALDEAHKVLSDKNVRSSSLLHMQAQVAYRREDFARAADIYRTLDEDQDADTNVISDVRINQSAVEAQLLHAGHIHGGHKKQPSREDLEQFETAFNAACCYLARGDLRAAEFLLTRAKSLCNAAEELSETDKQHEILPIQTQLVCVLCLQGKYVEAAKAALDIRLAQIPDAATKRVAQANLLATKDNQINPYLAQRVLGSTPDVSIDRQFFQFQKAILARNAMVVDLQAHKFSHVKHSSSAGHSGGVFAAAAYAKNQQGQAAIKELLPFLERRPGDIGLVMTIVQLYVLTNNPQTATTVLENFLARLELSTASSDHDVRYSPGLVGLTVSIYAGQNRVTPAKLELIKAAKHWRRKSKQTPGSLNLLKAAGAVQLERPAGDDEAIALEFFRLAIDPSTTDVATVAGLLAAGEEYVESHKVHQQSPRPVEELTAEVDASSLEEQGVAQLPTRALHTTSIKRRADTSTTSTRPKKIRQSRLPKDFDPSKKPDPERWLPLRERSSWRPKGKKKGKASQGMATQGGIANDDARPSTPQQQQQTQQKPAANAKSKKKKGKGAR